MKITGILSNYNLYSARKDKSTENIVGTRVQERTAGEVSGDSNDGDTLKISTAAYELNAASEKMTAVSGKDELEITKGNKPNSYVVHFADSAIVSRAVSRGHINVNGFDIELSDDIKRQLLAVDKQANADREKAYANYVMQHDMAVAKQQAEAISKAFSTMEQFLKIIAEQPAEKHADHSSEGVSWSQFDWKGFDTQMTISFGDTIEIESISEGQKMLSNGALIK